MCPAPGTSHDSTAATLALPLGLCTASGGGGGGTVAGRSAGAPEGPRANPGGRTGGSLLKAQAVLPAPVGPRQKIVDRAPRALPRCGRPCESSPAITDCASATARPTRWAWSTTPTTWFTWRRGCLLYTSDAADERSS